MIEQLFIVQGATSSGKTKLCEALAPNDGNVCVFGCDSQFRGHRMNPERRFKRSLFETEHRLAALVLDHLCNPMQLSSDDIALICDYGLERVIVALLVSHAQDNAPEVRVPPQFIESAQQVFVLTVNHVPRWIPSPGKRSRVLAL